MSWAEAIRIKRYIGNTGRVIHVHDTSAAQQTSSGSASAAVQRHGERKTFTPLEPEKNTEAGIDTAGMLNSLKSLLPKGTDFGDILVLAVFLFLYIESKDTDFLIILAVLAFSFFKDTQLLSGLSSLLQ